MARDLMIGTVGDDVMYIQNHLVALGYKLPVYGIDGKFGSETYKAVTAFQRDAGIKIDGVVGDKTRKAFEMSLTQAGLVAPSPYVTKPEVSIATKPLTLYPLTTAEPIWDPQQKTWIPQPMVPIESGILGISWKTWGIIAAVGVGLVLLTRDD